MPESTGARLKKTRIARGLSLGEISAATRIPPEKIEAIEADDYSGFPSLSYARGFLVMYGRYLNVDVADQAAHLAGHNALHAQKYEYLSNTPAPPLSEDSFAPRERSPSIVPLIVFVTILALISGGLWLLMNLKRLGLSFW
jgi:cytoskeletal protein RodZ